MDLDIAWVSTLELRPNPDNNNTHPKEQIDRLIEIINYQGFRIPIIVSNQSGLVVAGHGRLEAAKKMKLDKVPVSFQDFESYEMEYAQMTADNAIAAWATIDMSKIHNFDFGDAFNLDMLGFRDFKIEPIETTMPELNSTDPDCQQVSFLLSNEQKDLLDEAMAKAKLELDCIDEINKNSNGNILGAILRNYVQS